MGNVGNSARVSDICGNIKRLAHADLRRLPYNGMMENGRDSACIGDIYQNIQQLAPADLKRLPQNLYRTKVMSSVIFSL